MWCREVLKLEADIERLEAENKKLQSTLVGLLLNSDNQEHCPNCPDQGWYMVGSGEQPEQEQCEFCWTNSRSVFYQEKIKQALKDGK